jgi:adenylosuccinate synthase
MAAIVVIGTQWGDEGKGKLVDLYTEYADVIVRFQGGSNAGHTVVVGEKKTILHQIPSGILHPGKICIIGNGVVLNLEALLEEMEELRAQGYFRDERQLLISEEAHVVFPYHRLIDVGTESKLGAKKIGTTGRGIGPTYTDKVARSGIRVVDLFDEKALREKVDKNLADKNPYLSGVLGQEELDAGALMEQFSALARKVKPYATNTSAMIYRAIREGKRVLFEGAQGTMLDLDHGTYPYVTSSNTVAGAACTGSGVGPTAIDKVVGVVKAYTTRVGEGPFPTEQKNEIGALLQDRGKEFGATTGRPRRCGWMDTVVVRHASRVNGLTSLALTKLDVLTGLEKIKVCRAYMLDGKEVADLPASLEALGRCEPVYEEVKGWDEPLSDLQSYGELPASTKGYLTLLEDLIGVRFILISVGVKRDETILLESPFA